MNTIHAINKQLTREEAVAGGYEKCGYEDEEYQTLWDIKDINLVDFRSKRFFVAEKTPYYEANVSSEDVAEWLAENAQCQVYDMTNDDTDEAYDRIRKLDFSDTANKINEVLKGLQYWKLTDIQLIP